MILRIITSAELVDDDGKLYAPRKAFQVGAAYQLATTIGSDLPLRNELETAAARLLSETSIKTMSQVTERWTVPRDPEKRP